MSNESPAASQRKSPTWFQKGLVTLTRMGRGAPSPVAPGGANSLREIFTDLMAYVLFFDATCAQQPPSLNEFREKVVGLVNAQEERTKANGVAVEAFREARFAVLSWVDEMILNSNWPHRAQWQHLMLSYYGTLNAGEEFFRRLEHLPSQATDILEIYYLCLALGFQGRYAFADSQHELKELKQGIYRQLSARGDIRKNYARLFPEAYQKIAAPTPGPIRKKLFWYIAAVSIPIALFVCYWFILRHETNRLIALIEEPSIIAEPKDPLRSLVEELRRKGIPAEETPRGVLITLESLLFEVNSAELSRQAQRKIDDIVETVKRHAPERMIVVEGHASRERGVDETRNQRLSEDRARTVSDAFTASGFLPDKVSARGFGSKVRVADNETEQGRAKNRRVEIIVRK